MATFSPLTHKTYSMLEPNYGSRDGAKISRLIIHHTAGGTLSYLLDLFRRSRAHGRQASVTYVLDREGRLHGLVPEEYRPWTSGSYAGDRAAVTVETMTFASDGYKVTAAQLETLARLAADLSDRYGWGRLDRKRVQGHREWSSTSCPGPYLWPRLQQIADRANEIREGKAAPKPAPAPAPKASNFLVEITAAQGVNVRSGPGTGYRITTGVKRGQIYTITETKGDWGKLKSGVGWIHLGNTKRVSGSKTAPKAAPKVILQRGSTGTRVRNLQAALNKTFPAYRQSSAVNRGRLLDLDGSYGPHVEAWISEFQRRVKLPRTGTVDTATQTALKKHGVSF